MRIKLILDFEKNLAGTDLEEHLELEEKFAESECSDDDDNVKGIEIGRVSEGGAIVGDEILGMADTEEAATQSTKDHETLYKSLSVETVVPAAYLAIWIIKNCVWPDVASEVDKHRAKCPPVEFISSGADVYYERRTETRTQKIDFFEYLDQQKIQFGEVKQYKERIPFLKKLLTVYLRGFGILKQGGSAINGINKSNDMNEHLGVRAGTTFRYKTSTSTDSADTSVDNLAFRVRFENINKFDNLVRTLAVFMDTRTKNTPASIFLSLKGVKSQWMLHNKRMLSRLGDRHEQKNGS